MLTVRSVILAAVQNRVVWAELIILALFTALIAGFFLDPDNEKLAALAVGALLVWSLPVDLQDDNEEDE
ncbi:hypothetical protein ACFY9N_05745 [Microbacterium sp. NPDC008134]|uniref:hypothetical protein n=1 Tax=Microbacterium sp. NPDC008134 TaxID=3364183 RepID=UPI0036E14D61